MAKIQMEQSQETVAQDTVEITVESKPTEVQVMPVIKGSKRPSDWAISAVAGEDRIEARCNMTGAVFEGTIKAFNEMLRG